MTEFYNSENFALWLAAIHMGFVLIPGMIAVAKIEYDAWRERQPRRVVQERRRRQRPWIMRPQPI